MLAHVIPYYQRKLQWALFRGTALVYGVFGLIDLLRFVQTLRWIRLTQGLAFLCAALIAWQCALWLYRSVHLRLAERLGMAGLLGAATIFGLTAPSTFSIACTTAFTVALLFSALSYPKAEAWFWCSISTLLYLGAMIGRQWFFEFIPDPSLLIPVFTFPPLVFVVFTYIGIDVSRYLRETLEMNATVQESAWQYQQLLQTMNEGFVIIDENEVFKYVNDKWCDIFGVTAAEALGHRNEEVLTYDAENLDLLRQQTAIRTRNQRSTYELQFMRKDGEKRTVLVSAMPNFDANGIFRGAICVITDITQRKEMEDELRNERALLSQHVEDRTASLQAANLAIQRELTERRQTEEALKTAEEEYRIIFNNVPLGIYRSSLEGRQLRANPALVQLNGYTNEAEMLAAVNDIAAEWYVDPNRRAEFKRVLEEQGSVNHFESEIYRHKTRERIWISESAILVRDSEGSPLYYQGTVQDVTERKKIERQQERLIAELAKVAHMKDEFLANMSHELRTPLSSILGITEVLREQVYGPLSAKQLKALDTVEASGQHLLALINDILDLAKVEAGQTELANDWVEVNSLCQASLKFVQTTAQKKQLQIQFIPDSQVEIILADERRLKQILLNLLSNAVKFTPDGGTVGLEVIGIPNQGPSVQFVVWDTGVGIPQEAMERLFKPFVQLDSRLSRQFEGTGLGLALVYRMAELHGGSVAVESTVGQGSRFTVTLPWLAWSPQARPGATTHEIAPISLANHWSEKVALPLAQAQNTLCPEHSTARLEQPRLPRSHPLILLVEDNLLTVQMLADYLRFHGYRVEVAHDGVQALTKVRTEHPALILMDLQMPGMDGLETTRRIRNDASTAQIPIVALTALTMPGDKERCMEAGVNAYLSKPISLQELHHTVTTYLTEVHSGHE